MSSSRLSALLSATFYEPGYEHLVELVHQRDTAERRRLASLEVALFNTDGRSVGGLTIDPGEETMDLDALLGAGAGAGARVMVLFDSRYDERVFPYRPHHYAFLHRRRSAAPALYYAVTAVLGGVP